MDLIISSLSVLAQICALYPWAGKSNVIFCQFPWMQKIKALFGWPVTQLSPPAQKLVWVWIYSRPAPAENTVVCSLASQDWRQREMCEWMSTCSQLAANTKPNQCASGWAGSAGAMACRTGTDQLLHEHTIALCMNSPWHCEQHPIISHLNVLHALVPH